jgi:hypothetical protein
MAMTISFGESTGSTLANWGFILLILAIFLFFTGFWRIISAQWEKFFSAGLWTQSIANAKATWQSVPAVATPAMVQPLPPGAVPSPALMPMGTTPTVVPVVTPAGVAALPGTLPTAANTGSAPTSPLMTAPRT